MNMSWCLPSDGILMIQTNSWWPFLICISFQFVCNFNKNFACSAKCYQAQRIYLLITSITVKCDYGLCRYSLDQQLNEDEKKIVRRVLYCHPKFSEKVGDGVSDINVCVFVCRGCMYWNLKLLYSGQRVQNNWWTSLIRFFWLYKVSGILILI